MKRSGRPLLLTNATEHVPAWMRVRDAVLTLLLWLGCGYMWLQLFPELERWLEARGRADLSFELPAIVGIVKQGLLLVGGLLVFYLGWAVRTWRRTEADLKHPAPPALAPAEEIRAYDLPETDLPALRAAASLTIQTGPDGRIGGWQEGRITPPPPAASPADV
jgi:poly-beta-1,6-N-acetyl-D-glucosamine biosynthesis protein PgaD